MPSYKAPCERDANDAWARELTNDAAMYLPKWITYNVRAIRAFKIVKKEKEEEWVRPIPMTCWQVFINEDNMFEFIFWYLYKDNNWVRIYDMEGNMVYEVDMPINDPHIIVDLPDGMYTVKTFWLDQENPIQEFIMGKP